MAHPSSPQPGGHGTSPSAGDQVGLLHGGMAGRVKDATMAAFAEGISRCLSHHRDRGLRQRAHATFMVIEHAERFGRPAHQSAARRRGDRQSYCVLLYKPPLADGRGAPQVDWAKPRRLPQRRIRPGVARRWRGARRAPKRAANSASQCPGFSCAAAARDDARLLHATHRLPPARCGGTYTLSVRVRRCVRLFRAA